MMATTTSTQHIDRFSASAGDIEVLGVCVESSSDHVEEARFTFTIGSVTVQLSRGEARELVAFLGELV
jgi:hypothetical protein